jgi:hypothetical protein
LENLEGVVPREVVARLGERFMRSSEIEVPKGGERTTPLRLGGLGLPLESLSLEKRGAPRNLWMPELPWGLFFFWGSGVWGGWCRKMKLKGGLTARTWPEEFPEGSLRRRYCIR